ncbi:hypothetical protein B9G69_004055 [Bdellovibrio sp. SKB1291214]|uniref:hypothetical protein n=1 Tax=Bdellovibrio sp. SKB1291214 TaxID=1732569 RepID=UPI000B51C79A|nr:hypothetical protein [Bdellovibrio sp. SKB1291214]UYL09747.1 hypothetical protein B9G69_004055 [Bdellovibrio sp. SKB1291214]
MKHNIVFTSFLLLATAACSELQKVDEMHDATVKMSDTTEDMKQSTGDLKAATDELYDALRQGNALQLRREAYNEVMKAPTMFKKVSEATKYFMSFEFQLWNGIGQDTALVKRDVLGQQAAQEFFMEIEELAARDNSVNPLAQPDPKDITSEENRAAAFNAMAITMDQMNRKQSDNVARLHNDKLVTMYSMIEEALQAPREYPQTGYVREILAHEDKAIQLLQARYNMFPLMFIDMMTQLGDKNIFSQAKTLLLGWELDTSVMSATQVEYLRTEVLAKGLAAKELLIKIGKEPKLDSKVARLIDKMEVIRGTTKVSFAEAEKQQQLINMLKEFRK